MEQGEAVGQRTSTVGTTGMIGLSHFGTADVTAWYQAKGHEILVGDVVDHASGAHMSVGFARYAAGEENPWTTTYDEALIITSGVFTVRMQDGAASVTAKAGEVIYLPDGAHVVYRAETDAELVYVTHPHWFEATRASDYAGQLDAFQPAGPGPLGRVS